LLAEDKAGALTDLKAGDKIRIAYRADGATSMADRIDLVMEAKGGVKTGKAHDSSKNTDLTSIRDLAGCIKTKSTIDGWHKTPFRLGTADGNLNAGRTSRVADNSGLRHRHDHAVQRADPHLPAHRQLQHHGLPAP